MNIIDTTKHRSFESRPNRDFKENERVYDMKEAGHKISLMLILTGLFLYGCTPSNADGSGKTATNEQAEGDTSSRADASTMNSSEKDTTPATNRADASDSSVTDAGEIHPDSISGSSNGGGFSPATLCELAKDMNDGAGVYEVVDIIQYPQQHPGFTFVELSTSDNWEGPVPKDPTIVLEGGPTANGGGASGNLVSLKVGESIVALFHKWPSDAGYPTTDWTISQQSTFKDNGDGYTNGWLFADNPIRLSELKTNVTDMYTGIESGDGCPYDVQPKQPDVNDPRPDAGGQKTDDVMLGSGDAG